MPAAVAAAAVGLLVRIATSADSQSLRVCICLSAMQTNVQYKAKQLASKSPKKVAVLSIDAPTVDILQK